MRTDNLLKLRMIGLFFLILLGCLTIIGSATGPYQTKKPTSQEILNTIEARLAAQNNYLFLKEKQFDGYKVPLNKLIERRSEGFSEEKEMSSYLKSLDKTNAEYARAQELLRSIQDIEKRVDALVISSKSESRKNYAQKLQIHFLEKARLNMSVEVAELDCYYQCDNFKFNDKLVIIWEDVSRLSRVQMHDFGKSTILTDAKKLGFKQVDFSGMSYSF